ncbi:MAG: PQQ-dependent sugar dehydrogenase [Gemmatimonadetes bacterium]|nr:PQQ-dependent sugar dehydrogenase [Gemmatimonadota bacterium]
MKLHSSTASAVVALMLVPAVAGMRAQVPEPIGNPTAPLVLTAGQQRIRVVPYAGGLSHPWSIAFLPDGRTMLVTELPGRLRIIRDGAVDPQSAWEAPPAPDPQQNNARVRAVAVHPQFAQNRFVYVSHVKWGERGNTLAVSRGRLNGGTLTDVQEIFVADAWETSGNLGGRILFGPDSTLYITVGDRDRLCCIGRDDNSLRMKAQSLDNHVGKTLRIRDDGGVPADNPFVNRPGAKPEIFTYGHRNGYGLSFHPETGALWHAEIGPLGGDEVNILVPGGNYGWPVVSTGRNYTGTLVSEQPWFRPDMEMPRMFWVPSISPSSIVFYTGDKFPAWKNSLLVGALTTRVLQRVSFGNPSQDERRELLLAPLGLRIRDVAQGPDGYIYVATERDRAPDATDGTILRIEPAE